jgi:hypothetical protein
MNMVPGIGGAPQGLQFDDSESGDAPVMEISVLNPEDMEISFDGVTIDLMPEDVTEVEFDANLAEHMTEGELQKIASDLLEMVDADIAARKDWVEMYVKGLEVLGMKYEERTEPWDGACGVFSTVLTEAAVRFQSDTIIETFPAKGPVKTEIIGAINRLKEEAAERVRDDMNYQLTEVMPEYRPEHERMLYSLGLAGSAFKKVYYDPSLNRQIAVFIPAEDLIIPYGASSILNAERITHVMRKTKNDIRKLQATKFYRDVDLGEPQVIHTDIEKKKAEDQGYTLSSDDRYQVLEICVDYVIPGFDGAEEEDTDKAIAIPYIITIDRGTSNVLAIRRNWNPDDPAKIKREHFVQYTYIPGFGAYGLGLIHLIGGYARAGTSIIRQLVDAGTLSNLPGGLKARGLRVKGDDTPIQPGEFRDVDVPSGSVKDNIMMLPYKEPSQVLAGLLERITDEGRRLGSIADMKVSDMSSQAPVGTTLALLERQLKLMSAVQARVHYSMKQEFKLLKAIIRDYTPEDYTYEPEGGDVRAKQSDYDMVEVIPVSDPNSATMAQRIMQYQAAIQLSQQAPQIYDLPQLHRQMLEVLGIKNADKLVPIDDDMKPRDPLSENMAFLNGKPVKAFIYQDHDAHIATHVALKQDPLIMQQIGQNPLAQKMMAEIDAHIAEHLAFAYRKKLEDQMGIPMPAPDEDLPQDLEVQLSRLVAQAAQQLLAQSRAQAQQQAAQQMAQDPIMQMQQQELALKQKEVEVKELKVKGDLQLKAEELALKTKESAAKMGEDPAMAAARLQQEIAQAEELHGLEVAAKQMELQRAQAQMQQQQAMQAQQHAQKMAHGGQVHAQKLSHAERQAQIRARQALQKAQQPPTPKGN